MKLGGEVLSCARCRGTGIIHGPGDSPCFEVGHYCPACETGRRNAEKIADIVSHTLRLSRKGAAVR
jgi:hypothetical protein